MLTDKPILIVEDNDINSQLAVRILETLSLESVVMENGLEAVLWCETNEASLILMDMSLPVLDGWETTRAIKTDARLKHIPVIGLSAHAMSGDRQKALDAGCSDYLTKPLDDDLLLEKLDFFLKGGQ